METIEALHWPKTLGKTLSDAFSHLFVTVAQSKSDQPQFWQGITAVNHVLTGLVPVALNPTS